MSKRMRLAVGGQHEAEERSGTTRNGTARRWEEEDRERMDTNKWRFLGVSKTGKTGRVVRP